METENLAWILLSSSNSWKSRLIRWVLQSEYSHVGILKDYESSSPFTIDAYPLDRHVRQHNWYHHGHDQGYRTSKVIAVPVLNRKAGELWLEQQLGKPYGHTALIGYVLNRLFPGTRFHFRNDVSWTCFPLAYGFLMASWTIHPKRVPGSVPEVKLPERVIDLQELMHAVNRCKVSRGINPFDPDFEVKNDNRFKASET